MKYYKVTLKTDSAIQEWYVHTNSKVSAKTLVGSASGALARAKFSILISKIAPVGINLVKDVPVQWV